MEDLKRDWTLKISGIHACKLKLQKRLIKELYATFTRKPKLVVQVWNDRTQKVVNTVELESCQTSSITNDLKWPGETALSVGRNIERGKYHVIFTLAAQAKLNLVKNSSVTLASARVELDKVPKIVEDEGTWFVDLLSLQGSLCNSDSKLGVQLALVPTRHGGNWFEMPDSPITPTSKDFFPSGEEGVLEDGPPTGGTDSEKIVDLLDEAWTAGTIGRTPSPSQSLERASSSFNSPEARSEKVVDAPVSIRVHLHKICNLHGFNFLSLTGNTSIYAILYHGGQWKRSKILPKSSSPVFNDVFEFQILEPTSYITIAFIEEVQMPFSGMKERFRTSKLLGKIVIQPCCFPGNKRCHMKMHILSNKLIQRASPYALVSVFLAYESIWRLLDVYRNPVSEEATQLPVMETMPVELKALSTEDLMDIWSKSGSYSLTASIITARRTLRRAKTAKQEMDVFVLDPYIKSFEFLQSWKQPVVSLLFLVSYCRLCMTPRYIPSVLLLLLAAIPLYQYQSNIQYAIMYKSKFLTYKTWRVAEIFQIEKEGQAQEGHLMGGSPQSDGGGDQDHWIHSNGDDDEEGLVFGRDRSHSISLDGAESSPDNEKQSLRMRIKTVARLAQDYSNNVQIYSSYVEKMLHLVFWTDPRLSTMFLAACLLGALLLLLVPVNYVALVAGCYFLRPPQFRNSETGIIRNLWSRLPDNSDTF